MRVRYYIAMSVCALLGFSACEMQEEIWGNKPTGNSEVGILTLDVLADEPVSTKASVAATDFPVVIQGTSEDVADKNYSFNSVADFPTEGLKLLTGTYTISAHSNATLERVMTVPYYHGEKEVTIQTDISTKEEVICKMQNTKIEVALDDEFSNTLSDWQMTVSDGINAAISFSSAENKRFVYYHFENEIKELKLDIRGTLRESGNKIYDSMILKKEQASQKYEDVSEYFEGGEALKINLKLNAATEGGVKLNVIARIFFSNNYEQDAPVDVVFPGEEEETPSEPTTPTEPSGEGVDLVCDAFETGVEYSLRQSQTIPSDMVVRVLTPQGLKSMKATITGGNEGFAAAVDEMGFTDRELVGDISLESVLLGVGMSVAMPTANATTYEFPIGQFFVLMNIYGATEPEKSHVFQITVTDNQGATITKSLNVTINE